MINLKDLTLKEKIDLFKSLYKDISGKGIEGDSELAHINEFESKLLRMYAGSMTDKFLTEAFNSVGETSADKRNYLNSTYTLSTLVRGFQNLSNTNPLQSDFGRTEGILTISLESDNENKLIDGYRIFITYESKDERNFSASIGFMGDDDIRGDDIQDLGLEEWGSVGRYCY